VVSVTAGPGDEKAASAVGRGHLRAAHADREQVIGTLKAAFIQGRLTEGELDVRVGQALASRTYAELAAITADLPTALAGTPPPGKTIPAQAQPPNKVLLWGAWAVVLLTIGFMVGAIPGSPLFALVVGTLPLLIAAPVAGSLTLDSWREKRSRGQLLPRPAQSGQALEGERDAGPGNDLILCPAHRDTRARRLLGHRVTQRIGRSVPARRASAGLCT
jgi:Domain of unknown function (DUF1707)